MQRTDLRLATLLLVALSVLAASAAGAHPGADEVQVTGIIVNMVNTATGQSYTTSGQGFNPASGSQNNMGIGIAGASISGVEYDTPGFAATTASGIGGSSVTSYFTAPGSAYSGPLMVTVRYTSSTQISTPQTSLILPDMCSIIGTSKISIELLTLVLLLLAAALTVLSSVLPGTSRENLRRWAMEMAMGGIAGLAIVVIVPFIIGIFIFPAAPFALPC